MLDLLEEKLMEHVDPSSVSARLVNDYCQQVVRVRHSASLLNHQQQLEALDEFEKWYQDQNLPVSHQENVKRRREFWTSRME